MINTNSFHTPDKLNIRLGLFLLLPSLIIVLIIITAFGFLPPRLPLFYSVAWGEGQLVTHQQFLIIPASISLTTLLNLIVAWQLHQSQFFFKRVLVISSMIVNLVLIIAFLKIVLIYI